MSLPSLIILRRLCTSGALRRSVLSPEYKSQTLWDERFNCKLLSGDENMIRTINSKIVVGNELNNLEMDIFINIAIPDAGELEQLRESAGALRKFRRTLNAHTMLPSTPHAVCRLFLYSQRLHSIVNLLENRVDYGVFPDPFAMNLLLDEALDNNDFLLATRLAVLVMLQEEFSLNPITDRLSLLAVTKYIELKTNFEDWVVQPDDPALEPVEQSSQEVEKKEIDSKKKDDDDDDDGEEDVEYIRVPFLRNPYFDNHFDLKNPRILCGKVFSALGKTFMKDEQELGTQCTLLGSILQGRWSDAAKISADCIKNDIRLGSIKSLCEFYINNLHEVEVPTEELKSTLVNCLDTFSEAEHSFVELVESKCEALNDFETQDINELRRNFLDWSNQRFSTMRAIEERIARNRLIEEVRAKKEELRKKEDYLYFYDNLRKWRKTRIEYN